MDMDMPCMNGLEAARAIREIERKNGGRLPIIALTAHPTPDEEEACKSAGMDGYLAKPLRAGPLFEVIRRVVALPDLTESKEAPTLMIFDKSSFLSRLEGDNSLGNELIEMFLRRVPKALGWRAPRHRGGQRFDVGARRACPQGFTWRHRRFTGIRGRARTRDDGQGGEN